MEVFNEPTGLPPNRSHDHKIELSDSATKSFNDLKVAVTSLPILALLDFTKAFVIDVMLVQLIGIVAQQRWLYKLLGYEFTIEYKKGVENKVVDELGELAALSFPTPTWLLELKAAYDTYQDVPAAGHSGFHKCLHRARVDFYWPSLKHDVKKFIRECETCQRNKVQNVLLAGFLQPLPVPEQIWTDLSMDFVEAAQVASLFLNNVFKLHGLPKTIVSDGGSTFTSSFWKELFSDKPKLWVDWLSLVEWWYNSTFHTSTKMTPFEAVYGTPRIRLQAYIPGLTSNQSVDQLLQTREQILVTLKSNLSLAQERMKYYYDKRRTDREFPVGDWKKIGDQFTPFSSLPPFDLQGELRPQLEKILEHKSIKKDNRTIVEVLIQWKGAGVEDSTWEHYWKLQQQFSQQGALKGKGVLCVEKILEWKGLSLQKEYGSGQGAS
ncbi:hypothetical protein F2P56_022873 [Juglans regia]|uniref:Chromo domain-containing protein n=2 Tax=Juglans regia TaxID=51240 RepID=A0A833URG0_JUGRE|nr:uncharacterized protein LOC108992725 [Juglans regia]KAF5458878.1 hypothetical protein F2P56_022873 [Juglans regia]